LSFFDVFDKKKKEGERKREREGKERKHNIGTLPLSYCNFLMFFVKKKKIPLPGLFPPREGEGGITFHLWRRFFLENRVSMKRIGKERKRRGTRASGPPNCPHKKFEKIPLIDTRDGERFRCVYIYEHNM
jgi:hypothetical protein